MDVRVRIIDDPDPHVPDDEGHVPVVFIPYYGKHLFVPIGQKYLPDADDLRAEFDLNRHQMVQKLSTIGKVRSLHDYSDGVYWSVVTPEWLEAMGLPEDWEDTGTPSIVHWINDEVYGVVVEKRTTWVRLDGITPVMDETRTEWEESEAVYGCYGLEHAMSTAHDMVEAPYLLVGYDGTEVEVRDAAE